MASRFAALGLVAFSLLACSRRPAADESNATTEAIGVCGAGTHVAVHGMVLFGKEKLHLSHIPVFQAPHDMQVVMDVQIASGVPEASQVFVDELYTVKPDQLSLCDLADGALTSFTGTIFRGSFEQGGQALFANVKINVSRIVYKDGIVATTPTRPTLDYLALGTADDAYLVHMIDSTTSFDQVASVTLPANSPLDAAALGRGTMITVDGGVNATRSRLAANANLHLSMKSDKHVTGDSAFSVHSELYCSTAPDFFRFCPPVAP